MRRKQSRNVVRWYRLLPKNVVELSRSGPNMALLGFRRRQHGRRLASMLPHTHDPCHMDTPVSTRPLFDEALIQEEYTALDQFQADIWYNAICAR